MKKLILIVLTCGILSCTLSLSESEQNSIPTQYRYGLAVKIKEGRFKDYQCAIIREYTDSVFCRIFMAPDGVMMNDFWQTNQNFKKSNVSFLDEETK